MQLILAPRFRDPNPLLARRPGLLLSRALRKSLGSLFGSPPHATVSMEPRHSFPIHGTHFLRLAFTTITSKSKL